MYDFDIGMNWNNFKEFLDQRRRFFGKKIILQYLQGKDIISVTGEVFFHDVIRCAFMLQERGIFHEHIGLCCPNVYEWPVLFWAIIYSGNVPVLIDCHADSKLLKELLDQSDCSLLIYHEELDQVVGQCSFAPDFGLMEMVNTFMKADAKEAAIYSDTEAMALKIVNTRGKKEPCLILYTSGTTGKYKAVVVSVEGFFLDMITSVNDNLDVDLHSMLVVLPLHHLAGFSVLCNNMMVGLRICLGRDPGLIFRYLKLFDVDAVFVVPAILEEMRKRIVRKDYDQTRLGWKLKLIGSGGAKFDHESINDWQKTGIVIGQSYSASELSGVGIMGRMNKNNLGSVGKPANGVEARIVDGELQIKSVGCMIGYYKEPELTREVFDGEWYKTGDLAEIRQDGEIYLTGRKKNLIILSNGENVSPEGIEMELLQCPLISETMVLEKNDRLVCEVYVQQLEELRQEEEAEAVKNQIKAFVDEYNKKSVGYKQIYEVIYREVPFERTAIGKIVRRLKTEE